MRAIHLLSAISVPLALGSVLQIAVCNADNCARALTGTARGSANLSSRLQDCSIFQTATFYPSASTITVTSGSSPTTIVPSLAGTIISAADAPAFARKACTPATSVSSRFASACSCAGFTKTTVTAATPVATVIHAVSRSTGISVGTLTSTLTDTSNGTPTVTSAGTSTVTSSGVSTGTPTGTSSINNAQICNNPSDITGGVYNLCDGDSGCYCFSGTASGSAYCLASINCPINSCSVDTDCSNAQGAGLCLVTNCGSNCFYQTDLGQCVSVATAVKRSLSGFDLR